MIDLLPADLYETEVQLESPSPAKWILAQLDCLVEVPALSTSAKVLLELPEKNRRNPRFLALLAQKDPVFLARLLCLTREDKYSSKGLCASTADDAVAIIGASKSLSVMLDIASATPLPPVQASLGSPLFTAQQFVLLRCLAHSLTARRLAAYLELTADEASKFQIAVLLNSLGLYVALHTDFDPSKGKHCFLARKVMTRGYNLQEADLISDYHLIPAYLARRWHACREVSDILESEENVLRCLVLAVEGMVDAKRRKTSQQQALLHAVKRHVAWTSRLRLDEIDLAVLPC